MGQDLSISTKRSIGSSQRSLLNNMHIIQQNVPCISYGDISIAQIVHHSNYAEAIAIKEYCTTSSDQFKRMNQLMEFKLRENHPNIVNLMDYQISKEERLCSKSFTIKYGLQYYPQHLNRGIFFKNNHLNGNQKEEDLQNSIKTEEIWLFLEQMISALLCLQSQDQVHGQIKPQSIFTSDNTKQYKLIDPILTQKQSNYSKALQEIEKEHSFNNQYLQEQDSFDDSLNQSHYCRQKKIIDIRYLSPENLKDLQQKNYKQSSCPYKSDVFSLGVLILEMILGENEIYDLYCAHTLEFSPFHLYSKLEKVKKICQSKTLNLFLKQMLQEQPQSRPDFKNLAEIVLLGEKNRASLRPQGPHQRFNSISQCEKQEQHILNSQYDENNYSNQSHFMIKSIDLNGSQWKQNSTFRVVDFTHITPCKQNEPYSLNSDQQLINFSDQSSLHLNSTFINDSDQKTSKNSFRNFNIHKKQNSVTKQDLQKNSNKKIKNNISLNKENQQFLNYNPTPQQYQTQNLNQQKYQQVINQDNLFSISENPEEEYHTNGQYYSNKISNQNMNKQQQQLFKLK